MEMLDVKMEVIDDLILLASIGSYHLFVLPFYLDTE